MLNLEESALKNWLLPTLIIFGLSLGLAFPWLAGGKVLAPLDIVEMYLPWRGDEVTSPAVHNHCVTDTVLHYIPY